MTLVKDQVAKKKAATGRAARATVKKQLPSKVAKPAAVVATKIVKPLDERKREANRRHKVKSDAEQVNLTSEAFVMQRYGVTLDVFISDAFSNQRGKNEGKNGPTVAELMDEVEIAETNMLTVKINKDRLKPWKSGTPLDRLLSRHGGILPGTVNIITGEPSAGKTTICGAYLIHAKRLNKKLLAGILNAEMSLLDWEEECDKNPALREVGVVFMRDLNKYKGNHYLAAMRKALQKYELCVVDSLAVLAERIKDQTSMTMREAMFWLVDTMNELAESEYRAYFVIQHFSKGLEYIGPTKLKHDTTAMAYVLFDSVKRPFIVFNKNRRSGGLLHIPLYTKMAPDGLLGFDEPRLDEFLEDRRVQQERDEAGRDNKKNLKETLLSIEENFINKLNEAEELAGEDKKEI